MDLINASTPVFHEDQEEKRLREAKKELARLKRLSLNQQLATKFGTLKLYMDLFIEWKAAQAQGKTSFSWQWGKLRFSSIEVYEWHDGTTFCPIMDFKEFSALLIVAYSNY